VPIIKLVDRRTKVKVDISFNQVYGVHSVKIIKVTLNLSSLFFLTLSNFSPFSTIYLPTV